MKELVISATLEHLEVVQQFISDILDEADCPMKIQLQIQVVVEEIYVNIAHYAYAPAAGDTVIRCGVEGSPKNVFIEFQDGGKPFNPLAKKDPDITLSSEERPIGGLGILMVKRMMDEVTYRYEKGNNILTMRKKIQN